MPDLQEKQTDIASLLSEQGMDADTVVRHLKGMILAIEKAETKKPPIGPKNQIIAPSRWGIYREKRNLGGGKSTQ